METTKRDESQQLDAIRHAWPFEDDPPEDVAAAVANEMADYQMLIRNTSRAFEELSRGRFSKPNTAAQHVIEANTEYWQRDIDEAVAEATHALEDEVAALRELAGLADDLREVLLFDRNNLDAVKAALARYDAIQKKHEG